MMKNKNKKKQRFHKLGYTYINCQKFVVGQTALQYKMITE